ncbi:MAG TPA: PAS domain S-box protein, partial [Acidobacteriota bacterium]
MDVNDSFCRMLEFSREEVVGHTSTELNMWTPEERKKLIDEQIRSGGLQNFELQAHSKSGTVVNILFSSKPIELEGETHHITTLIDITERKRAEERIVYQGNLLANVNDAVIASDENFVLTSWNRAAERIYGWTAEEVIGKSGTEILQSEFLTSSRPEAIKQLIENGEYLAEVINPRKDGVKIYIETRTTALRDPIGKTVGYVSINRDITERKRAEAEIQRRVKELEALHQASLSFSKLQEIEAVGEQVLQHLEQMMEYQRGAIVLRNETSGELELIAHVRMDLDDSKHEQEVERVRGFFELPHGITRWVAEHGEPIRTGDVQSDPRYLEADPAIRSEMAVPLKIGERILGALNVESAQPDAFSEHDERL